MYEALYWAQELVAQNDDLELETKFALIDKELEANIDKILEEMKTIKGKPVDIIGY